MRIGLGICRAARRRLRFAEPQPVFTVPPSITGNGLIGSAQVLNLGTAANADTLSAQLTRSGAVLIASVTDGQTYTPVAGDDADDLILEVTATGPGGTAYAEAFRFVTYAAPSVIGAIADVTLTKDVAMTPVDLSAAFSGPALAFRLAPSSPPLPAGLTLDGATGILSGTPTENTNPLSIVVQAFNSGGTAVAAPFTLDVDPPVGAPVFTAQPTLDQASYASGDLVTLTLGTVDDPGATLAIHTLTLGGVDKSGEVSGLTWDTTGEAAGTIAFRVSATNAGGTTLSDIVTAPLVTPASAPASWTDALWELNDKPSAGGNTLTIRLIAHPSDGGSPVTATQYRLNGGAPVALPSTAPGYYDITVPAGAPANVELRDVNAIGAGLWGDLKTRTPTVLAGGSTPTFITDATGPYFVDPANVPAGTTNIRFKAKVKWPTGMTITSNRNVFTQESTGCDLQLVPQTGQPGAWKAIAEDGAGTQILNASTLVTVTLGDWQVIEYEVDLLAPSAALRKNGTVIWSATPTTPGTPSFQTTREVSFLGNTAGASLTPPGVEVEYLEVYFNGTLRKRIAGDAATVNADPWKRGGDALAGGGTSSAPAFTTQPAIAGDGKIGSSHTLNLGAVDDPAATVSAVLRRGATVLLATVTDGQSYIPTAADDGQTLTLEVTATNVAGSTTASGLRAITYPAPVFTTDPAFGASGYTVGQTATFSLGASQVPATLTVEVFTLDGADRTGELSGTSWDTTGEAAGTIALQVRATNSGGTVLSATDTASLAAAAPGVLTASNVSELQAHMNALVPAGGAVIELADGNYTGLVLTGTHRYAAEVVIRSQNRPATHTAYTDRTGAATFLATGPSSPGVTLTNCQRIAFENVRFYAPQVDPAVGQSDTNPCKLYQSNDRIRFTRCEIAGSPIEQTARGAAWSRGIVQADAQDMTNLTFEDNWIHDLSRGCIFSINNTTTDNVNTCVGNYMAMCYQFGFQWAGGSNITQAWNFMRDFFSVDVAFDSGGSSAGDGALTAATASTVQLPSSGFTAALPDDAFLHMELEAFTGPNTGQKRTITGYNAATRTVTFSGAFTATPSVSDRYKIRDPSQAHQSTLPMTPDDSSDQQNIDIFGNIYAGTAVRPWFCQIAGIKLDDKDTPSGQPDVRYVNCHIHGNLMVASQSITMEISNGDADSSINNNTAVWDESWIRRGSPSPRITGDITSFLAVESNMSAGTTPSGTNVGSGTSSLAGLGQRYHATRNIRAGRADLTPSPSLASLFVGPSFAQVQDNALAIYTPKPGSILLDTATYGPWGCGATAGYVTWPAGFDTLPAAGTLNGRPPRRNPGTISVPPVTGATAGATVTSAPVQIGTVDAGTGVWLDGGSGEVQILASDGVTVVTPWTVPSWTYGKSTLSVSAGQYVQLRQTAPAVSGATALLDLRVGTGGAQWSVTAA